jgi:hypothetical protein
MIFILENKNTLWQQEKQILKNKWIYKSAQIYFRAHHLVFTMALGHQPGNLNFVGYTVD